MKIYLSPQGSDGNNFKYTFIDDILTVECDGKTDEFDFTDFPDGRLQMYDDKGNELVETKFEVNPLISAEKKEGVLYLELLNRISDNATEEEKFPEWIDSSDYVFKENEEPGEVDDGENSLEE